MFQEKAQIVGCELAHTFDLDEHGFRSRRSPTKPWQARMVYHALKRQCFPQDRINAGIRHAKTGRGQMALSGLATGAASTPWELPQARKERSLRSRAFPLLILDGDGCDRSHGGEGQTATRPGGVSGNAGRQELGE